MLSNLILSLYGSATSSDQGKDFLTRLKRGLNLKQAALIIRPPTMDDSGLIYVSGDQTDAPVHDSDDSCATLYMQDPLYGIAQNRLVTIDDMIPRNQLLSSEYFRKTLSPLDIHYLCGFDCAYQQDSIISIRFVRSEQQGLFNQREKAFLSLLIPHMQQSLSLGLDIRGLRSQRQIYSDAMSGRSLGVLTLDRFGRILQSNASAKDILRAADGISEVNRYLRADNADIHQTLSDNIRSCIDLVLRQKQKSSKSEFRALSVPRLSGMSNYQLIVRPLDVDLIDCSDVTPFASVWIQDPTCNRDISVRTLMEFYSLTISEATISILFSEGNTTEEVANQLGVTRNTIRAHLRTIYAKTGVTQQSKLVALVLTSLASTI
ncbi:helix-turn-helix transcriptional regulator [Pseudomaricurvus alkylphenolicus]|nr:helix-turn-helix transcriptional regulator [Pseudomaricurvus alkylphenolicus]